MTSRTTLIAILEILLNQALLELWTKGSLGLPSQDTGRGEVGENRGNLRPHTGLKNSRGIDIPIAKGEQSRRNIRFPKNIHCTQYPRLRGVDRNGRELSAGLDGVLHEWIKIVSGKGTSEPATPGQTWNIPYFGRKYTP